MYEHCGCVRHRQSHSNSKCEFCFDMRGPADCDLGGEWGELLCMVAGNGIEYNEWRDCECYACEHDGLYCDGNGCKCLFQFSKFDCDSECGSYCYGDKWNGLQRKFSYPHSWWSDEL